jgi:CheY-like chemotaxis protein
MVLLRTGVKVIWAKDGLQAIEMARLNTPDLILMDIKMPIMDGLEATREIKKFLPFVPVIAQTAYAMENDERISLEAGCAYYITKPIRKQKLLEVVNKYLK